MTTLADVSAGQTVVVRGLSHQAPATVDRLLDLGFLPGTPVQVIRRAPLGDPVTFEIRGYQLCLRKQDAQHVTVEA